MPTTTTINEPPEFLRSYYAALAQRGMDLGNLGFTPYNQDKVAPLTSQQQAAAQMTQQRALGGSQDMNAAGAWFRNTLAGQNNVGPMSATYGPNSIASGGTRSPINANLGMTSIGSGGQVQGVNAPGQIGPVNTYTGPDSIQSGGQSVAGRNQYLGLNNPYLNQSINNAMDDVSGRINSRFNSNAFGGTAHQQTLARELGRVSNDMRMSDYNSQMGLAENDVNRNLSNQQFNIGNQNQLNQYNANLGMTNAATRNQMGLQNANLQGQNIANTQRAQEFNSGVSGQNVANQNALNSQNAALSWQGANTQNSANQFNSGLQSQNIADQNALNMNNANLGFQNAGIANNMGQFNAGLQADNIGRQQSALSFAPTLAANDYADASAMMNLGTQLQGQNQNIANSNYQEFLRQQQYPTQQMQWMSQGLAPAGNAFSSSSTNAPAQQTSSAANALGGGMLGYSALNAWNGLNPNSSINPWLGALGGGLLGAFGG